MYVYTLCCGTAERRNIFNAKFLSANYFYAKISRSKVVLQSKSANFIIVLIENTLAPKQHETHITYGTLRIIRPWAGHLSAS